MKENELRRINTEHKSDNQESHSLITRFSSMTLDQFQREINTMLNGYTYEEAIKFSPEDFAKFQPGRSERQEKVRNALIAVAPDLENDIKIFKSIHLENLYLIKDIHRRAVEKQLESAGQVPETVLAEYPDLKEKLFSTAVAKEKAEVVNEKLVKIMEQNFNSLATKFFGKPDMLKTELSNMLGIEPNFITIENYKFCEVFDPESRLAYIAVFPYNRPLPFEVAEYFKSVTSTGESGQSNAPVQEFKRIAITHKTDNSSKILIRKGKVEVMKI